MSAPLFPLHLITDEAACLLHFRCSVSEEPLSPLGISACAVKSLALVLSKPGVNTHRRSFAEDAWQWEVETNKTGNRVRHYVTRLCVCVCVCGSSVFQPCLSSFTVNWWVRNSLLGASVVVRAVGNVGNMERGGREAPCIQWSIYQFPIGPLPFSPSSYFSSYLDGPTCLSSSEHFTLNLTTLLLFSFVAAARFLSLLHPFV